MIAAIIHIGILSTNDNLLHWSVARNNNKHSSGQANHIFTLFDVRKMVGEHLRSILY